MTSQYSTEHNGRATDGHESILEQIADQDKKPGDGFTGGEERFGLSRITCAWRINTHSAISSWNSPRQWG